MVLSRQLLSSVGGRTRARLVALRLLSSTPLSSPSSASPAAAEGKDSDSIAMLYHVYGDRSARHKMSPLVIGHGLFGQIKNWRGVAKVMAERLGSVIYIVDWRNHGDSPHHPEHSYPAMARDLARLIREVVRPQTGFEKVSLLGHSMGGKAVACFAVDPAYQPLVDKLIIEDVAVQRGGDSVDTYRHYVRVMKNLDLRQRKPELAKLLRDQIEDHTMRYFLLSNVRRAPVGGDVPVVDGEIPKLEWQLNFEALDKWMDHIIGYGIGEAKTATPFKGPTLLVTGEESTFVKPSDEAEMRQRFFPNLEVVSIPYARHWVHNDQGNLLIEAIAKFLNAKGAAS